MGDRPESCTPSELRSLRSCVTAGVDATRGVCFDRCYKGSIDLLVGKTNDDIGYVCFEIMHVYFPHTCYKQSSDLTFKNLRGLILLLVYGAFQKRLKLSHDFL